MQSRCTLMVFNCLHLKVLNVLQYLKRLGSYFNCCVLQVTSALQITGKEKTAADEGFEELSQSSKDMAKFLKLYRRLEAEQRIVGVAVVRSFVI